MTCLPQDQLCESSLISAIEQNNLEQLLKALVNNANPNLFRKSQGDFFLSPLLYALQQYPQSSSIVKTLITFGADPNLLFLVEKNSEDQFFSLKVSLLTEMCCYYDNLEAIKFLLSLKANPNSIREYVDDMTYVRNTPLLIAIEKNNLELLKVLIEGGADVNLCCAKGISCSEFNNEVIPPISLACQILNDEGYEFVKLLLKAGVDLNKESQIHNFTQTAGKENMVHQTAIFNAIQSFNPRVTWLLRKVKQDWPSRTVNNSKQSTSELVRSLKNNNSDPSVQLKLSAIEKILNKGFDEEIFKLLPKKLRESMRAVYFSTIKRNCNIKKKTVMSIFSNLADIWSIDDILSCNN